MPYFMRKERDKFCIFKGTSNDPGELVKCHEDKDKASAHLRALMANVDDAKVPEKVPHKLPKKGIEMADLPPQAPTGPAEWETMKAEDIMKSVGKGDELVTNLVTGSEQNKEVTDVTVDPVSTNLPDDQFIVYKSGNTHRWLAISNVATQDKEFETITDKAYDDAITIGKSLGYGELDLVHVPGTDVADCDLMLRLGDGEDARLVEGGVWYNDPRATNAREAVQSNPSHWGVSIKFVYDPAQFVDGVYHGGIRIKKRTILPRHMAASYGTAIAVLGGEQQMKELDQETKDALAELRVPEEEIELLSEQTKSLPDEVNTRTKEGESFLDTVKTLITNALGKKQVPEQEAPQPDVAEQSKETETEVVPVETAQETETVETKEATDVENIDSPAEEPIASEEVVKAIAETVALSLAPSIKETIQPLTESLTSIVQWQADVEKRLLETEKDVETRTIEHLESQPPVVKVRPTELKQTEDPVQPTAIMDSPESNYSEEFMKAVEGIVASALKTSMNMPEIKLSDQ